MSIISDPLSHDVNPTYAKAIHRLRALEAEKARLEQFIEHIDKSRGYALSCNNCDTVHVIPLCELEPELGSILDPHDLGDVRCLICGERGRPNLTPYDRTMEGKANAR